MKKINKILNLFIAYFIYYGSLFSVVNVMSIDAFETIKEYGLVELSIRIPANPKIDKLTKDGRIFVAKMELSGLESYFNFESNEDVQELINRANEKGSKIFWYYADTDYIDIEITFDAEELTGSSSEDNDNCIL